MAALLALMLPMMATAIIKPSKDRQLKHFAWMTATVEDAENVVAKPSEAPFRPNMEILNSEYEVGHSKTVEVYWQRPNTTEVKGIFFGATGCFHQAGDFFEEVAEDGWKFPACKNNKLGRCQGLPENVYAFKYARERGYLTLTINPQGPNSCWDKKYDPLRLDTAVKYVIKREGLKEDIPMYATGASQGGVFLFDAQAAQKDPKVLPNLACLAPQCAAPKHTFENAHLPTMFIWMVKDHNLTNPVLKAMHKLKSKHVRVAERTPHPWKIQELMRARGYSNETTEKMLHVLLNAKGPFGHKPMARNGHLVDHPGFDDWWKKAALKVISPEEDSLMKDHSKFHHLMQVAYAEHEFTSEYTDHMIDFCEDKEDVHRPLRFGREPIIAGPSPAAMRCSPNCPMPGAQIQLKANDASVAKPTKLDLMFETHKK
eukprot:gnl/MRDRNA2_/MRDRNA2_86497_c0_seq1.p1 gnl/MRDRNA2_/MRDRNA2_86497_c0~~gnl/MRDRNA2_/MRDRNA2_86497_c0_seq1.p1  ORF type:complete len:428 (+),score=99.24 gnl/MRDRNA2_/MRDRNA2_86497_c0_seq1:82-1365(+)